MKGRGKKIKGKGKKIKVLKEERKNKKGGKIP